jgi:hypothetical protein
MTWTEWLGDAWDWASSLDIDYGDLVAGGVAIAGSVMDQEDKKDDREFKSGESQKDREHSSAEKAKDREAQAELQRLRIEAEQAMQKYRLAVEQENQRRKILGEAVQNRGKDQGAAMLESYKASANKPERFNTAANNLANLLASG